MYPTKIEEFRRCNTAGSLYKMPHVIVKALSVLLEKRHKNKKENKQYYGSKKVLEAFTKAWIVKALSDLLEKRHYNKKRRNNHNIMEKCQCYVLRCHIEYKKCLTKSRHLIKFWINLAFTKWRLYHHWKVLRYRQSKKKVHQSIRWSS